MNRVSRLGILMMVVMLFGALAAPATAATTRFSATEVACVEVDPGTVIFGDDGSVQAFGVAYESTIQSNESLLAGSLHRVTDLRIDANGKGRLAGYGVLYPTSVPSGWWEFTFTGSITGPRALVHIHAVGGGDLAGASWSAKLISGTSGCESGGASTITGKLTV